MTDFCPAVQRFNDVSARLRPHVFRVSSRHEVVYGNYKDSFGDPFKMASIRKFIVTLLFGKLEHLGLVNRDSTLEELRICDLLDLGDTSKVTLRHLLSSTSGVIHPAAGDDAGTIQAKATRDFIEPGSWFYNNWDFNVLSHIVDDAYPGGLPAAYTELLAKPLGLQLECRINRFEQPQLSRFPAHQFWLPLEDLEQIGLLVVEDGRLHDKEIIPSSWIQECTRPKARTGGVGIQANFGFGCYVATDRSAVLSWGSGGQVLLLLPHRKRVFTNLMQTHHAGARRLSSEDVADLVDAACAAFG